MKNAINSQALIYIGIAKHHINQAHWRINSMYKTRNIINELQSLFSRYDFEKLVKEEKADKNVRNFKTWNMLKVLLIAQYSQKKGIRDIVSSLRSRSNYWAHLGLESLSRNNLSNALMKRSSAVFEKTFYALYEKMIREGYRRTDKRFKTNQKIMAIDSTTISLCLNIYKWARFRKAKGGVKVHTMFNVKEQLPVFATITKASRNDATQLEKMPIEENGIYVMDRGYFSVKFFKKLSKNGAFFITRTKSNVKFKELARKKLGGDTNIEDVRVVFAEGKKSIYSESLRIVRYTDVKTNKRYEFITNNFDLAAEEVAAIYKSRWDIELFFKHIKQNLKITRFYGRSANAVRIQIWVCMIGVLLAEYMKYKSRTAYSSLEVIRIIGENIFGTRTLVELMNPGKYTPLHFKRKYNCIQLGFQW